MGLEHIEIQLTVIQGQGLVAKDKNLFGKKTSSDPYTEVWCNRKCVGKTSTKKKTLDPVWNKKIMFKIKSPAPFILKVYDEDLMSSPDLMGAVSIPCPTNPGIITNWYEIPADSAKNASGKIEVKIETNFITSQSLIRGNEFDLAGSDLVKIGLAWDMVRGKAVDLDVSAVAIANNGQVSMPDTVYYGNTANRNRSITHSGDEREGDEVGDDEFINLNLPQIPRNLLALYIVLTVATPGIQLSYVRSAVARVRDVRKRLAICSFRPSSHALSEDASAMFLLRIARDSKDSSTWKVSPIEDTHAVARDFGSLIPHLKSYTQDLLPSIHVDPTERVAIMRKGGNVRLRDYCASQTIPSLVRLGLAWDVTNGVNIDLDASVVCLDSNLNLVDQVFFGQLKSRDGAIRHHGDEREGDSIGDDEKIDLRLEQISPNIQYVGFCINSYSGQELDDVSRASCHLFDPENPQLDLCSYALSNASHLDGHTALVLGCLYRGGPSPSDWCLCIISEAAQGRTVKDNVDEFQNYLRRSPPQVPEEEFEIVVDPEMPEHVPLVDEEIDLSAPMK